jgi:hypothetical protein
MRITAKQKRQSFWLYTITAFAVLFALSLTACDNGTTNEPVPLSETYEYVKGGSTYRLTITQNASKAAAFTPAAGDAYVLVIITGTQTQTSSGTVASFSVGVLTLKPSQTTVTFTVHISDENKITAISGTITIEGSSGTTVKGPDTPSSGGGGGGGGEGGYQPPATGNGTAPTLTAVTTGPSLDPFIPKTTFTLNEKAWIRIQGEDPDRDVEKAILTLKKGDSVQMFIELEVIPYYYQFDFECRFSMSNFTVHVGNYTLEVQLVDSNANKSSTLSASFTVVGGTDPNGTAPAVTSVSTGTYDQANNVFTPKTTFASNETVYIRYEVDDPDEDIKTRVITLKKEGTVERSNDVDYPTGLLHPIMGYFYFPDYPDSAGNYTWEVQVIDSKGNQSNILSASFTVQ